MTRPLYRTPRLEALEARENPAVFGLPWLDARHLTLSFVPDGTIVDRAPSVLYDALSHRGLAPSAWQRQILSAFQAWASGTNINVRLVADSGADVGADGATQGDPRFGDVRVAARPYAPDVLALTTPPGTLGGTRAGDIVLNTEYRYGSSAQAQDLLTVFLQEAGHALGVGHSPDPASVMFEFDLGPRTA